MQERRAWMQVKGTTQAQMQGNGNGNMEREQKQTCAGARTANREGGRCGSCPTQEDVAHSLTRSMKREQKQTCAGARTANREGGRNGSRPTQEDVKKAEGKDFTENMLKNMFSHLHMCKKNSNFATEKKG